MAAQTEMLDTILAKLVRDVETSVHALYRGDVRQATVKAKTEVHRQAARSALAQLLGTSSTGGRGPRAEGHSAPGPDLSAADLAAITRCITGWLPMGAPGAAAEDSRCVPAGRELVPSWGDRERARLALKRLSGQ